ncbi:cytochrome P450, family 4, subfamily T, polypeptide 8 [Silurus meridionalis]|nr:cytochrome P450, family 4, subfamily T, polypeptide 8 [Silurus meridionalis]
MELQGYFLNLTQLNLEGFRFFYFFTVVCVVYISAVLIKWSVKRKRWMKALQQFPGPPGHWLLGHVTQFKQDGTDLQKIPKWGEEYPFAFPMQFSPDNIFLFVHHPSYVKPILATTGEGLLVTAGDKWFRHRRLLTPGFRSHILKPYVNLMSDSAKVMLDKWEVYARTGQNFELFEHVSLMTLDSIMKCAFSCQSNCQTVRLNPYIKAVYELCNLVNLRFRVFPYHNDIIFHMSPHGYRYRKACKIAHDHTDEVIRQRREILNIKKKQGEALEKRYFDFLDILLCANDKQHQGLSDEGIRAEVDTFMFEGHDTTASGISWIFYSMACNPEHQQKCREEIQQVLMGKDTIEWNCIGQNFALNEMKVVVALTLRKYVLIKDPDHTPKMIPRLVLRSLNGIHLKIKLVEN